MEHMNPTEAAHYLFDQHGDEIYRYIRFTIGNKTDAEDILQDIFLRVVRSWNRFNHKSSPKTWVWAIANNCIREYVRKQVRSRNTVPYDDTSQASHSADPLFDVQLQQSLATLSTEQRQVFIERIIHDKSSAETAEELGWSESKVRTTLHRAVRKIQTWFKEGGEKSERS